LLNLRKHEGDVLSQLPSKLHVFPEGDGTRISLRSAHEYITTLTPPIYGPEGGSKTTPSFAGGSSTQAVKCSNNTFNSWLSTSGRDMQAF